MLSRRTSEPHPPELNWNSNLFTFMWHGCTWYVTIWSNFGSSHFPFPAKTLGDSRKISLHRCIQAVDESTANFDAALRKLATYCEFRGALEKILRDRFVCGLCHEATQHQLLTQHALTYQKALDIARVWKLLTTTPEHKNLGNCQLIRFLMERRREQKGNPVTPVG